MFGAFSLAIFAFIFLLLADSFRTVNLAERRSFIRNRRDVKSCTFPEHIPKGKWTLVNSGSGNGNNSSGDFKIPFNSVVKFECDEGYKPSTASEYFLCNDDWDKSKIPECLKLCPPVYSTPTTRTTCTDKNGEKTKCHEATDGTRLKYECKPYYEIPTSHKNNLLCTDGSWNYPKSTCKPVCGRKKLSAQPLLLQVNANEIIHPWVAAVYKKIEKGFTFVCGGSLISRNVVLTAAHCVTDENGKLLNAADFKVGAGKFYSKFEDPRDSQAQYSELELMSVPKEYKGVSNNYFGDLAILKTRNLFNLSSVVQPICFNNVDNVFVNEGQKGEISEWARQEDGKPSDKLRTLEIPYKSEATCAKELPEEFSEKFLSTDKICAGFHNLNVSMCQGISGTGLAFKDATSDRYYIHGLASVAPYNGQRCGQQQNTLYTKISQYYEFIDRELFKHGEEECFLPEYPRNGKWTLDGEIKNPGDAVPLNTVLNVVCDSGFSLSSEDEVKCDGNFNLPKCLAAADK